MSSSLTSNPTVLLIVALAVAALVYLWNALGWSRYFPSLSAASASAPAGGAYNVAPAPIDMLSPGGKESFVADTSAAPGGAPPVAAPPGTSTLAPSDLLPTDGNTLWNTVGAVAGSGAGTGTGTGTGGGADLVGQIVPAELMDPTRMPQFTSTSKSKVPNQQWWRPDPLVDRSLAASQWFGQAPDTHIDDGASVPNQNVEITSLKAVPL